MASDSNTFQPACGPAFGHNGVIPDRSIRWRPGSSRLRVRHLGAGAFVDELPELPEGVEPSFCGQVQIEWAPRHRGSAGVEAIECCEEPLVGGVRVPAGEEAEVGGCAHAGRGCQRLCCAVVSRQGRDGFVAAVAEVLLGASRERGAEFGETGGDAAAMFLPHPRRELERLRVAHFVGPLRRRLGFERAAAVGAEDGDVNAGRPAPANVQGEARRVFDRRPANPEDPVEVPQSVLGAVRAREDDRVPVAQVIVDAGRARTN